MTNLEKLDSISELQKALEQQRARADKAEDDLRDMMSDLQRERGARQRADDVATSWAERGQEAESRALHATARAEQAERKMDEQNDHLNGFASFVGPCVHGRDPWTRCETCTDGNAVTSVLALLRKAERELTAWRAEAGAGRPEDAGAAIRNTRIDLRRAEMDRDEYSNDYKQLEATAASVDVARICAEKERDKWKARAEQSELGREETLRMWREYKTAKDADVAHADAARERAEAEVSRLCQQREEDARTVRAALDEQEKAEVDNAALLEILDGIIWRHTEIAGGPDAHDKALHVRQQHHPGASLLEYVRALEEFHEASGSDDIVRKRRALAAVDALRGKR